MRALVTGGAGFLGSHLVDALLARGDEAVVLDHRLRGKALPEASLARVRGVEADVCDPIAVREAAQGCSLIFHCAAMVGIAAYSGQPARTMETEESGLRNVCAAARRAGAKVVYASSSAVYGRAGWSIALDETLAVSPESNYGTAKRFGELYLAAQNAENGLRSAALRIFNMYGPRQDHRLVIPRFIGHAMEGRPIEVYGDGAQTRDFVFVADVVAAALAMADRVSGCEVVNACSGQETSVRTLAEAIVKLTGSKSDIVSRPMPDNRTTFEVDRCYGSRAKLQRIAGRFDPVPLETGLARTISHIRACRAG